MGESVGLDALDPAGLCPGRVARAPMEVQMVRKTFFMIYGPGAGGIFNYTASDLYISCCARGCYLLGFVDTKSFST